MARLHASAERPIAAPAEVVYRCIADFREHHPRWLPPEFSDVRVEQGGYGAGTMVRFTLTMGGRPRHFHTRVGEPEPGRVITETDDAARSVTTFTVNPTGTQCQVRIETEWENSGGIAGLLERLVAPRVLRDLYGRELENLDKYSQARA